MIPTLLLLIHVPILYVLCMLPRSNLGWCTIKASLFLRPVMQSLSPFPLSVTVVAFPCLLPAHWLATPELAASVSWQVEFLDAPPFACLVGVSHLARRGVSLRMARPSVGRHRGT